MQFIDLATQQKRIRDKIEANITTVLDHGKYIMGPEIKTLEQRLADYAGVKHAIGCASGTDALLMALMALKVGPGDAVFTSPFTFIATAEVISLLGATPVLVGIRAAVAQTIVELGVDMEAIVSRGNMQEGLEYALSIVRGRPGSVAGRISARAGAPKTGGGNES